MQKRMRGCTMRGRKVIGKDLQSILCPYQAIFTRQMHAWSSEKGPKASTFLEKKVETLDSIPGQRKKAKIQNRAEKFRLIVNQ